MINEEIFHSYDTRGIYPDEINEEAAFEIGKAFAKYIGGDIAVGRDARLSSPALSENFAKGVNALGFNVIDLGICTTPMAIFAVAHKKFLGGAMISASHNPPEYNGIKFFGEKAVQLSKESGIDEIKELVLTGHISATKMKGQIKKLDILPEYEKWLVEKIGKLSNSNFVVDYGNGVGALSAHAVFSKLNLAPKELYSEPDGTYPNHLANPVEEKNLVDLKKAVLANHADLGFAFDGDADRAIVVDENGKTVSPGFLLAALASQELKNHRGEKVYYDLRFSKSVPKAIKNAGGVPEQTKVGNPYYKYKLNFEGGLMAAEYSGHFMYQENYGIDDGLFSALKVLYWLEKTGKKMSEFVGDFERGFFITGEINLKVKDSTAIIGLLEQKYADAKIDKLDGITAEYSNWWFNLRASNTEPVVRLNIEADSQAELDQKKQEILDFIKANDTMKG